MTNKKNRTSVLLMFHLLSLDAIYEFNGNMNSKRVPQSIVNNNRPRNLIPISPTPVPAANNATATGNGHSPLDSSEHSRSATITKLKKVIKQLSEENKSLRDEITEQRETVRQIFNESRHEKYDERRINMIKFQVIQLERQISILAEALGSRSEALWEVENSLTLMADRLRCFISAEIKGQMVPIARSDLMNLVEICESSRIKLFKSIEKQSPERLGKDLLCLNPCLHGSPKQKEPVTLLDINLDRLDYINLRYVSQLESKLSVLYKDLVGIHNQIETVQGGNGNCRLLTGNAATSECERLKTSLLKAGVAIRDCTDDLLALSLLCPSAPWPVLRRPVAKEIPVDRITAALPPMTATKQEEASHLFKACISTMNHRLHLTQKEKSVLEEELAFHRAVYETQIKYTNTVFDAVREGCQEFEQSARTLLCVPIQSILEAYNVLEATKSKGALREILLILKANESQMKSILEMFEDPGTENNINRSEALSSFSAEFMQHVDSLVSSCQIKRDKALEEKKEVRDRLRKLDTELRQCIEELEAKYDKQWVPKQDRLMSDSRVSNHYNSSTDLGISKDFIHSQLFGDLDCSDGKSSGRQDGKTCRDTKGNHIDDLNENIGALKLRSFLDDNDNEGSMSNPNSKRTVQKTKWVSDFATHDTMMMVNAESQLEKTQSSSSVKKPAKPWKPEKEWEQDFTTDFNLMDEAETSPSDIKYLVSDERLSSRDSPKETQAIRADSRNKTKGSRRLYEVDLRVANHRLKLKRPDSFSDGSGNKSKK